MRAEQGARPPIGADAAVVPCLPGDGQRLALLLARHGLELARHLRRIVRDDDAAADLLQDTFLRAHSALGRLRAGSNARAWLYRIATNAALNHLRSRSREDAALRRHAADVAAASLAGDRQGAPAGPDWAEREAPNPGDRRQADAQRAALWARVATLPERQRLAITLRIADELDYAEIARRMGGNEAAARANVHQAVKRLKRESR